VEKMARQCRTLVVPEMNMGQVSREIKRVNQNQSQITTLNRVDGKTITPAEILKLIQKG
jgi:2-oxoglutarate ferredoxin oxidoreductase subunit alpha